MIVAGVMSGTSADGINVALLRMRGRGFRTKFRLLAYRQYPYSREVRRAVLNAMNARSARVADLARLNFLLGELYAEALLKTLRSSRMKSVDLVGCHGQTLYHQGEGARFFGKDIAATWQTGEAAVIAARVGAPVVSDFRPADVAVGGKGAPLVPFLDYLVYRHKRIGRILQNIGGIANLTAIPAAAAPDKVVAFDTGPGNMVMDALMERLFRQPYDRDGRVAAQGKVREDALTKLLQHPFFAQKPPKTAGREEFGREFVAGVLRLCRGARKEDVVATATALTARSIDVALRKFCFTTEARRHGGFHDLVVSGGGARNRTLARMIAKEVAPLGLRVRQSDEFGVPSDAKEAIAFAVLAYQTWRRQPSNVPAATGARRAVVLGKVSY
ncbi:MAG: anhydro-N-acetylmuramic acid kinase [Acidobacteria bacterium]|nr:anhydro-N-acetylmuramic acid kinase [Acidobacteriota bacterium]